MKKGFLLIDGCKNAVILDIPEIKETEIYDFLARHGITEKVRRNKDMKELDRTVREYLKGGWNDEQEQSNDTDEV